MDHWDADIKTSYSESVGSRSNPITVEKKPEKSFDTSVPDKTIDTYSTTRIADVTRWISEEAQPYTGASSDSLTSPITAESPSVNSSSEQSVQQQNPPAVDIRPQESLWKKLGKTGKRFFSNPVVQRTAATTAILTEGALGAQGAAHEVQQAIASNPQPEAHIILNERMQTPNLGKNEESMANQTPHITINAPKDQSYSATSENHQYSEPVTLSPENMQPVESPDANTKPVENYLNPGDRVTVNVGEKVEIDFAEGLHIRKAPKVLHTPNQPDPYLVGKNEIDELNGFKFEGLKAMQLENPRIYQDLSREQGLDFGTSSNQWIMFTAKLKDGKTIPVFINTGIENPFIKEIHPTIRSDKFITNADRTKSLETNLSEKFSTIPTPTITIPIRHAPASQ